LGKGVRRGPSDNTLPQFMLHCNKNGVTLPALNVLQ
jgi:hypothetical protein